ncbi:hypothetical protein M501DRAFT_999514 [Patellaria atrata CBS 101060]|uniref:Uncharacterized protein n=1 Tax=Patellaria atrata CBS 101060 TaxID=1346257 RepID=A0A9P4VL61_9PEZI|nr:hypothetical protein M501DRAFT_999514 [Patellaria atrata CBS 101060]
MATPLELTTTVSGRRCTRVPRTSIPSQPTIAAQEDGPAESPNVIPAEPTAQPNVSPAPAVDPQPSTVVPVPPRRSTATAPILAVGQDSIPLESDDNGLPLDFRSSALIQTSTSGPSASSRVSRLSSNPTRASTASTDPPQSPTTPNDASTTENVFMESMMPVPTGDQPFSTTVSDNPSVGTVAGAVVGSIFGLVAICAVIWFCVRRRKTVEGLTVWKRKGEGKSDVNEGTSTAEGERSPSDAFPRSLFRRPSIARSTERPPSEKDVEKGQSFTARFKRNMGLKKKRNVEGAVVSEEGGEQKTISATSGMNIVQWRVLRMMNFMTTKKSNLASPEEARNGRTDRESLNDTSSVNSPLSSTMMVPGNANSQGPFGRLQILCTSIPGKFRRKNVIRETQSPYPILPDDYGEPESDDPFRDPVERSLHVTNPDKTRSSSMWPQTPREVVTQGLLYQQRPPQTPARQQLPQNPFADPENPFADPGLLSVYSSQPPRTPDWARNRTSPTPKTAETALASHPPSPSTESIPPSPQPPNHPSQYLTRINPFLDPTYDPPPMPPDSLPPLQPPPVLPRVSILGSVSSSGRSSASSNPTLFSSQYAGNSAGGLRCDGTPSTSRDSGSTAGLSDILIGEPGPTRPGTAFAIDGRQAKGISDPFDLDKPEVLGFGTVDGGREVAGSMRFGSRWSGLSNSAEFNCTGNSNSSSENSSRSTSRSDSRAEELLTKGVYARQMNANGTRAGYGVIAR